MNTLTNKIIAYLTLLTGLAISSVAVYYSVAGLTAIFSAAVIPIIVMGVTLEISKLVATVWLKQNWEIAPFAIKSYLISAIVVLMLITSMGIFGFLSKAHADQSLVSGDVQSQISVYDEKIKVEQDNIATDRKELKQMDDAVDQLMSRSDDERGAEKSVKLRKSQAADRTRLLNEISESQKRVSTLNEERAPLAAQSRKVEAEVGPIKYIAAFIYGSTDQTILERAVTWVILILIFVFDPLAVILLLASQHTFKYLSKSKLIQNPDKVELWNSMIEAVDQKTETANNSNPTAVKISQSDYINKSKENLQQMISKVKDGIMPFYEVPDEMKEDVKKGLNNAG